MSGGDVAMAGEADDVGIAAPAAGTGLPSRAGQSCQATSSAMASSSQASGKRLRALGTISAGG